MKIMTSGPITSWQVDGETMETVTDFAFLGSEVTADGDYSYEIKTLAPWKKSYDKPAAAAATANSLQSCLTLCDPIAHQALLFLGFSRQEYWSGLPFPSPVHSCMLSRFSCVQLCVTLWTAAHQAPLSTGFSKQEYWSGLPFPSMTNLDSVKKQRHYFANKGLSSQSYGFSSSHIWMWELDHKEGWR